MVGRARITPGEQIELTASLPGTRFLEFTVRGQLATDAGDIAIDARKLTRGGKTTEHRMLLFSPTQFRLFVSGPIAKHAYTFGRVDGKVLGNNPVRLRLDIGPLAKELGQSDEALAKSLRGEMSAELFNCPGDDVITTVVPPDAFPVVPLILAGAGAIVLGAAGIFMLRRRRLGPGPNQGPVAAIGSGPLTGPLSSELNQRVHDAYDAALSAANDSGTAFAGLAAPLTALYDSARGLISRLDRLEATEGSVDEPALVAELKSLREAISPATAPAVRDETARTIAEKERVLALLAETRQNLATVRMRVERVAAVFDGVRLKVLNVASGSDATSAATSAIEPLVAEVTGEVKVTEEALAEIRATVS